MRLPNLLSALLAATANLASADADADTATRTVSIYIQPLSPSPEPQPSLLAELAIPSDSQPHSESAEVLAYEAPDFSHEDTKLVRIGVYDPSAERWVSSTSVASVDNFAKGYAPHFVLSLGPEGKGYLGVLCRGVAIDAGQTRDFGPQAVVVRTQPGAQPVLGKPVVLSPEGRRVVGEEKTFVQKYWWALAIGAVLLLTGGGDQK